MKKPRKLSPSDRRFFQLVTEATFSNPFGTDRAAIDRKIIGDQPDLPEDQRAFRAAALTKKRLNTLFDRGLKLHDIQDDDRHLVRTALLFEVFHHNLRKFDDLVLRQLLAGDALVPCPFAEEMISDLIRRGIARPQACGYIGMFYQLRRAFYFIQQSLIGTSSCMQGLRMHLWQHVFTHSMQWYERYLWNRMEDFSALLVGETGTGKGAAAAAIARSGYIPYDDTRKRFNRSFSSLFLSINLSQFPETLIESELFGHRKGSFTGALSDYDGFLSRSSPHTTVFLDEIGDAGIPIQIKLLRVLQERVYSPVGSHDLKKFQGRVLGATNLDIDRLRADGLFRDDFYYRLSSDVIRIPTLQERLQEDPGELEGLLHRIVEKLVGHESAELTGRILEQLERDLPVDYHWPGNVRELEQAARRVMLTQAYHGDRRVQASATPEEQLARLLTEGQVDAKTLLARYCGQLYRRHGSYEEVARITDLDRRTARKYVVMHEGPEA